MTTDTRVLSFPKRVWEKTQSGKYSSRPATSLDNDRRLKIYFRSPPTQDQYDAMSKRHQDIIAQMFEEFEDEDFDPTPYCHGCGAMTAKECDCGPYAENE